MSMPLVPEDIAANLISDGVSYEGVPEPWVFDGTRRQYVTGKPAEDLQMEPYWAARAVDPSNPELGMDLPVVTATGATPMEATENLVKKLQELPGE